MSELLLRYRGREIRSADAAFIQSLIAQNPGWSRRRLSAELCRAWHWVQPNGALRDMVCRSLLLQLHRAGHIELPAKRMDDKPLLQTPHLLIIALMRFLVQVCKQPPLF